MLFELLYPAAERKPQKTAFSVGDFVRIQLQKGAFDKSFRQQFTDEIYKVSEIVVEQNVITYRVVDLNEAKILGSFYVNELTKITFIQSQHVYAVDRILAKRVLIGVKQLKTRWRGFDISADSWIDEADVAQ